MAQILWKYIWFVIPPGKTAKNQRKIVPTDTKNPVCEQQPQSQDDTHFAHTLLREPDITPYFRGSCQLKTLKTLVIF